MDRSHKCHHLSWCYSTLASLRKLKHLVPFLLKFHLAESLILARHDYNDTGYLNKQLQQVPLVTAGFVHNHYARETGILHVSLGWLPFPECVKD